MINDLFKKNRSYRRFDESLKIEMAQLRKWVEAARYAASGRNMQPMKYVLSTSEKTNAAIFEHLSWAGYLSNWKGPGPGERPVAYVAVLHDKSLSEQRYCDDGLAIQNIMLAAVNDGFGGCIIGSVNKVKVSLLLGLPAHLELLWVIALGKPAETVVLHDMQNAEYKYWRDENNVHHVPKRTMDELVFKTIDG